MRAVHWGFGGRHHAAPFDLLQPHWKAAFSLLTEEITPKHPHPVFETGFDRHRPAAVGKTADRPKRVGRMEPEVELFSTARLVKKSHPEPAQFRHLWKVTFESYHPLFGYRSFCMQRCASVIIHCSSTYDGGRTSGSRAGLPHGSRVIICSTNKRAACAYDYSVSSTRPGSNSTPLLQYAPHGPIWTRRTEPSSAAPWIKVGPS
jgi:hypothetical protein